MANRTMLTLFLIAALLLAGSRAWTQTEPARVCRGLSVALPADGSVKLRWVIPPCEPPAEMALAIYTRLDFTVDGVGRPWVSWDGQLLLNPTRQRAMQLSQPFASFACLENGAFLFANGSEVGFAVAPPAFVSGTRAAPLMDFQPIAQCPGQGLKLFAGENTAYIVTRDQSAGEDEVYFLRPEGNRLRSVVRAFAAKEEIAAATGDGDTTYVAVGSLILSVSRADGSVSKLYVDSQPVTDLAYGKDAGLFYATDAAVGYIGPNGHVQLLAARMPRICLRKGSLYVLLPDSMSVIALDDVGTLRNRKLDAKQPSATQLSGAKVTNVRLFEGGDQIPKAEERKYTNTFDRATTRCVYCKVDLENLLAKKTAHQESVRVELTPVAHEESKDYREATFSFGPKDTAKSELLRFGMSDPGSFWPGEYRVIVLVNGVRMAERRMTIRGGGTALELALMRDSNGLRKHLEQGGDPNKAEEDGTTPLMVAAATGAMENLKLLIDHGASANARTKDGYTALVAAMFFPRNGEIIGELLNRGADPNIPDNKGITVIFIAMSVGDSEIVRSLLAHGADANATADPEAKGKQSALGFAMDIYAKSPDSGTKQRMREIIALLREKKAVMLPDEEKSAFERGLDSLLDPKVVAAKIDSDDHYARSCRPMNPALRRRVLQKLVGMAYNKAMLSSNTTDLSAAFSLCEDARRRAVEWGMLERCPEISLNCGLMAEAAHDPNQAIGYLEEYLRLAPDASDAKAVGDRIKKIRKAAGL